MSIVVRDEPIAAALGALPWRDIPIHGPDDVLLGRLVPGRRSWRSAAWNGEPDATGDEVLALLRELRRVTPGIIAKNWITVSNPVLALRLAESNEGGVDLRDADGKYLGRFVPEAKPEHDEPHVVDDHPTGPG